MVGVSDDVNHWPGLCTCYCGISVLLFFYRLPVRHVGGLMCMGGKVCKCYRVCMGPEAYYKVLIAVHKQRHAF